jgi:RNA polymerase primary sigma factor
MDKEILFGKALEAAKAKAKEQNYSISEEQVKEIFGELSLSDEQMEMVYQYLRQHKIGIGEPPDPDEYLLDEDKDYLEEYLRELGELSELSQGEKEAVTLSAMAGDGDAQRKLIEIYLPEVAEIAKLYAGQGVYLEDLIGEGNVAVTMGVTMLGAMEHASEVQGMLGKLIMDAMEEYIADNADEKKKNNKIVDKVNKVADAANELYEELHRKVTIEELVAETGMSRKAVEDAIRISGDKIEALSSGREA